MDNDLRKMEISGDCIVLKINPKIYPLDIVYSAAYMMLDRGFIMLDGDPEKEIVVEIRKKESHQNLNTLVQEFNAELLNYAVYKVQSENNKALRELILQRVLMTNAPNYFRTTPKTEAENKDDNKTK